MTAAAWALGAAADGVGFEEEAAGADLAGAEEGLLLAGPVPHRLRSMLAWRVQDSSLWIIGEHVRPFGA